MLYKGADRIRSCISLFDETSLLLDEIIDVIDMSDLLYDIEAKVYKSYTEVAFEGINTGLSPQRSSKNRGCKETVYREKW